MTVRVSGLFALAGAGLIALIIADFLNHQAVTSQVLSTTTQLANLAAGK